MEIVIKVIAGILIAAASILAVVGLQSLTRGTNVCRLRAPGDDDGPPSPTDPLFCETLSLLTKTTLSPGHEIEVFSNGDETYPRLWEDLRAAERSITLQMYYCQPGRMADEFKSILLERAKAGVRILFLRDAFGSGALTKEYIAELEQGGIQVAAFRPTRWYQLFKVYHRSHIRVAVIDGQVGYTGGFGIDDKWWGDGKHENQWRDTNARFTGPAVLQHQATFAAGWAEATGTLLSGDLFFPPDANFDRGGNISAGLLHASPSVGSTSAERYYAFAIGSAKKRLFITNSYFVPSENFCQLLVAAAKRGVDVRVLTAGPVTDVRLTRWAGRKQYPELLRGGVRVYEYQPTMMHAKTLVVDGIWSSIGTMNFDNRSMVFNNESNLNVLDDATGATMDSVFLDDLRYSTEITLAQFEKRGLIEKLLELGSSAVARLL
jgi:cardiolipin synthase A/B